MTVASVIDWPARRAAFYVGVMDVSAQRIWDYLMERIGNPFGVAGVMGNLYAESGLNPKNIQNSFEASLGYTDETYTAAVDSGAYRGFVEDGAGYGLAQWSYWSRKQRLIFMARERGTSVGDLDTQLEMLWTELQAYSKVFAVLKAAKTVREASDAVLTGYEKPRDQSEAVQEKRATYGQKYYDVFIGGETTMAVKVGSARIDENGNAKGGKAGDQTGKEVSTQNWYLHSKGWRVFRAKNPAIGEKIAQDMQYACNNSKIGYDQNQRGTLYSVSKPLGFNCSKVTTPCETDCSALVRVCCAYAGVDLPNFRTTDEASVLLKSGAFVEMKGAKYQESDKYLLRGDIMVTKTQGHTVVVLSNGSKAGSDTPAPTPVPSEDTNVKYVTITGDSVNVRKGPGTSYGTMGTVKKGKKLKWYGYTYENGWNLVDFDKSTGWVSGKYSKVEG